MGDHINRLPRVPVDEDAEYGKYYDDFDDNEKHSKGENN